MEISLEENSPEIDASAWIAPTATVIGNVSIGAGTSIWYGTVLRADMDRMEIGEGSNVQDNCVFHVDADVPLSLGSGVSVGHGAIVHGATVGDNSLIGMGAILLNRSVIGEECLVAAGTLVPEGMEVPPRSLIAGVPGKVRRELTDEEVAKLRQNAEVYQGLRDRHRAATA
ncbi:MAG: gamma carbonic anhydrase family protein [Propionibacteriaceae bacterium]